VNTRKDGMTYCSDCGRVRGRPGVCSVCKERRRHLAALHARGCSQPQPGRELRVELYRKVIELGGRIFE
jgi:hypothetical protein